MFSSVQQCSAVFSSVQRHELKDTRICLTSAELHWSESSEIAHVFGAMLQHTSLLPDKVKAYVAGALVWLGNSAQ